MYHRHGPRRQRGRRARGRGGNAGGDRGERKQHYRTIFELAHIKSQDRNGKEKTGQSEVTPAGFLL